MIECRDAMDPSRVVVPVAPFQFGGTGNVKCRVYFEHLSHGRIVKIEEIDPETNEVRWVKKVVDRKTTRVYHGMAECPISLFGFADETANTRKDEERVSQKMRIGYLAIN